MALKHDRISIEVFGPSAASEPARSGASRADEAVMILARLIGRQIAQTAPAVKSAILLSVSVPAAFKTGYDFFCNVMRYNDLYQSGYGYARVYQDRH